MTPPSLTPSPLFLTLTQRSFAEEEMFQTPPPPPYNGTIPHQYIYKGHPRWDPPPRPPPPKFDPPTKNGPPLEVTQNDVFSIFKRWIIKYIINGPPLPVRFSCNSLPKRRYLHYYTLQKLFFAPKMTQNDVFHHSFCIILIYIKI